MVSVPRTHRLLSSFNDGNLLDNGIVSLITGVSVLGIVEHEQHDRVELLLCFSGWASGFVVASFLNETMPWRQRGHAIEPGGAWGALDVLLVEHRYNAHRVHSSCKQPVTKMVSWICRILIYDHQGRSRESLRSCGPGRVKKHGPLKYYKKFKNI